MEVISTNSMVVILGSEVDSVG